MNKLEARNVSKHFKNRTIFENINLEFESGKIYGIVGPNGCGKSVLFKILSGLMQPNNGQILYNGKQLYKEIHILPSVGLVINDPQFYNYLSGYENLYILASIKNLVSEQDIIDILNKVGLQNDKSKVKTYSTGMKQRLALAQAIMENPDVLILDEITNGIDKTGLNMVYDLLKQEKENGKIIIITSHRIQDIKVLCDEVYEIDNYGVDQIEKDDLV
ncbi:ABC transporter ATP-binding protein [Beduini massiliensis]|uniref:ABC transporter ATP-binding protein n=1 Tax=Beduini massiliensis TaxID=1585974 RepID=UPI00059AAE92|nr:ABC transporter ATP-binding protein [Beduini massiliensis]